MNIETEDRFWKKVLINPDGCWEWQGTLFANGYGGFAIKKERWITIRAHRFAYESLVAPIPKGLEIDHLCRNHKCVNPAHLEAVTHQVNCQRGENGLKVAEINKAKTHCKRGHPYSVENTYLDTKGARMCRICRGNWRRIKTANQLNSPL